MRGKSRTERWCCSWRHFLGEWECFGAAVLWKAFSTCTESTIKVIIELGLNWIMRSAWKSSAWTRRCKGSHSRQGRVCGIQGSACFWELLQGVGLAPLSLPGKWDIYRWDVAAGSPAGRAVAWAEFHLAQNPGALLLWPGQRGFRPFSSGSQTPACFQPGAPSRFPALWKAIAEAVERKTQLLHLPLRACSSLRCGLWCSFVSQPCLWGLMVSAEAPGFPFRSTSAPCTFCFLCNSWSLSVCWGIPLPGSVPN